MKSTMKKIVTLLLAVAAVSGAFAQSRTTEEAKRILTGIPGDNRTSYPGDDRRVYDERSSYPGSRSGSEDGVNREYDEKIRSIRNNRTLSNAEKDRIIRDLENQRQRRLQQIRGYDDRRYDDHRYDNNYKNNKHKQKNKGNNGKHLGWEKGKGNPHKRH